MIVVDASVLVSVYWSGDAHHQASRAWLERYLLSTERARAPLLLLSEVAGAVTRRTNAPALGHAAVQQIQQLPRLTLVSIGRPLGNAAARLAADMRLKGPDALYVALAAQLAVPLITWDHQQHDRGAQQVTTYYPTEV